jgi:hypothetical protein
MLTFVMIALLSLCWMCTINPAAGKEMCDSFACLLTATATAATALATAHGASGGVLSVVEGTVHLEMLVLCVKAGVCDVVISPKSTIAGCVLQKRKTPCWEDSCDTQQIAHARKIDACMT